MQTILQYCIWGNRQWTWFEWTFKSFSILRWNSKNISLENKLLNIMVMFLARMVWNLLQVRSVPWKMQFAPRSHICPSFLGLANYLKRFIPNYSTLTYPLRTLTKKDSNFDMTENCEKVYYTLKNILTFCIHVFNIWMKRNQLFCIATQVL